MIDTKRTSNIPGLYKKLLDFGKSSAHPSDAELIHKIHTLSNHLAENKLTNTPESRIIHSLHVANIVIDEIGLGTRSVACTLLYPFVDEGDLSIEEVKKEFGEHIALMIDSLARISGIETKGSASQAEKFRKLLLTLASDVRVILIKLSDRLHLMRVLDEYEQQDQLRISSESFYLYAPLAHRLGLYNMKSEMEDLAMKYLESEQYDAIVRKLKESATERDKFIQDFIRPLRTKLTKEGFDFEIKGRPKSVFSIWTKMKKQHVDFEEVYDKFAIRIILNSKPEREKSDCWRVYSIVTDAYQPNPKRLRDWISVPKSNGYESLHTTVIVPGGNWVEVQIRTQRMNEIAEKGLAAHWKYKGIKGDSGLDDWLNKVREVLDTPEADAMEFINNFKLSLYSKEIFVFTPNGDLKQFPSGATVLDFAFDIHTDVGSSCVGARVNGRNVPIRHVMKNGDKVEIITSKNQKPKRDWLEFVVTSKAKNKIKLSLKEELMREAENGREMLKRRFRNWKVTFNDKNVNKLLKHYKQKTALDLYYLIATEKIDLAEIKEFLKQEEVQTTPKPQDTIEKSGVEKILSDTVEKTDDYLVIDDKIANVDYKLSKCCNPIFGDKIFGFVTVTEGIKIHRVNCPNAAQLLSRYGYRVVKAKWTDTEKTSQYQTTLKITGVDDIGIVNRITDVISKDLKVNMRSIAIESNDGMFEGTLKLFVKDTGHLKNLIDRILSVKGVLNAVRLDAN
ncbi:MAG TPA: RelA/SpoT family protein [Bacteroidales bacterium]|nr:RelA/SpoT family protein [Bacteroidales bacterium]